MSAAPGPAAHPATVDVVVVTRDTREITEQCIDLVLETKLAREGALTCIVVDNASSDGTAASIAARRPEAVVVRNDTNVGFGAASNHGARLGAGGLILLLNSDVLSRPGSIERLVEFLVAHPDYAAAGARLVDLGTERTQVGFVLRSFPRLAGQVALLVGLERIWPTNPVSRRQLMLDFDYTRTQQVDAQPAGACLLCRRTDFEAIGGFDEGFYYWFEDVDLVKRLEQCGRIAYVHDAVFEHVGGATFAQWKRPEIVTTRYASLLRYFTKHRPRWEVVSLRAVVAVLAAIRAVPLAFTDRPRARAYASVVKVAAGRPFERAT